MTSSDSAAGPDGDGVLRDPLELRVAVTRLVSRATVAIVVVAGLVVIVVDPSPAVDRRAVGAIVTAVGGFHLYVAFGRWHERWAEQGRERMLVGVAAATVLMVLGAWTVQEPEPEIHALVWLALAFVISALVVTPRMHVLVVVGTVGAAVAVGLVADTLDAPAGWALFAVTMVGILAGVGSTAADQAIRRSRTAIDAARSSAERSEATSDALRAVVAAAGAAAVPDDERVLEAILAATAELGAEVGVLSLIQPDGTIQLTDGFRIPLDRFGATVEPAGVVGAVLRTGAPVVVEDYQGWGDAADTVEGKHLRSAIGVPIATDGEVIGVLVAGRYDHEPFSSAAVTAMELLAGHAERALDLTHAISDDRRTLARLRRLHALQEDFVATVSHELRTPLAIIEGMAETLDLRDGQLDDALRGQLLSRLRANATTLNSIVTSLLDSASLDRGLVDPATERIRLADVVAETVDRLAPVLVEHEVVLRIDSARDIVGDPDLLGRVVENLLTNLERHTPSGTRAEVAVTDRGSLVVVTLNDDGPGIPASVLPTITDRFQRGPGPQPTRGLGIGLALCDQVLRLHGGRLEVTNGPSGGAQFRFALAAAPTDHETPSDADAPDGMPPDDQSADGSRP